MMRKLLLHRNQWRDPNCRSGMTTVGMYGKEDMKQREYSLQEVFAKTIIALFTRYGKAISEFLTKC